MAKKTKTIQRRVHVYTAPKSVAVDDRTINLDFEIPEVFPKDFFYLLWWERDGVYAYFTADADGENQVRHDLEPTDENYATYVQPFVDVWESKVLDSERELTLQKLSLAFEKKLVASTVESSLGFTVDADTQALINVQQLRSVMELGAWESVEFCDADNVLHTIRLADVEMLEKEIAPVAIKLRAWKFATRARIKSATTVEEVEEIEAELNKILGITPIGF